MLDQYLIYVRKNIGMFYNSKSIVKLCWIYTMCETNVWNTT